MNIRNDPSSYTPSAFAAIAALCLLAAPSYGATNFTDDVDGNARIVLPGNWDNGVPTSANPGFVSTGFNATYASYMTDRTITFNGNSTLAPYNGTSANVIAGGSVLTFNDSSVFYTASGAGASDDLTLGRSSAGNGSMILNDSASAVVGANIRFGGNGGGVGSLTLADTSTLTYSSNLLAYDTTHMVTLADSATLTGGSIGNGGGSFIVNFMQDDTSLAPSWNIVESSNFDQVFITYQINGVGTTLADDRFVLTEGVGGYDTLTLTTMVPEPATTALILGSLLLVFVSLRRSRKSA